MEGDGAVRNEEEATVTTPVSHGKPYAGKLHVRFDEGAGVPDEGRSALLYWRKLMIYCSASCNKKGKQIMEN